MNLSLLLATSLLLAVPTGAQTAILLNGDVYDGNGGPLTNGNVYHIVGAPNCGVSVPPGRTLTVQAGAIVKIDGCFIIGGTMNAAGTAANPIIFTSIHDDSAGGDTNGNGSLTTPAPGDWGDVDMGGLVTCDWTHWRYGGLPGRFALGLRGSPHVFRDCTIEDILDDALAGASEVRVERTQFNRLGGIPVTDLALRSIEKFVDNTATQCGRGEYARITDGRSFTGNLVMDHRYSINATGVFVFDAQGSAAPTIPSGTHWTLPAGTVFKYERGNLRSSGDLIAQGTAAMPVVFTSLRDDTFGGDTENDGTATSPAPGDWDGIELLSGDASTIRHATVRYAGRSPANRAVHVSSSSASLRDTIVEHSAGDAILFGALASPPAEIVDCVLRSNALLSVRDIHWAELARCRGNTALNNGSGDHFRIAPERISTAVVIAPDAFPGDVLEVGGGTATSAGGSLTLPAGTILKFPIRAASGFAINASSSLMLRGTARRPIVLTSFKDDTWGGDTNGDGAATQPAPNDWGRLFLGTNTGSVVLENVLLRYGSTQSLSCGASNASIRAVRVDYAAGIGMTLSHASGDVMNAIAFGCTSHGIELTNRSFDLLHATAANNGGSGIRRAGGWSGTVINSIAWGNAMQFEGLTVSQVSFSNGGFAGQSGNINQDPQFVNAPAGDLHLQVSSPCLGVANTAAAIAVARDHDESSRVQDHALVGFAAPDMGAFERSSYSMIVVGDAKLGSRMTLTLAGPSGAGVFYLGVPSATVLLQPFGVYLAGFPNLVFPSAVTVGQSFSFSIPNRPILIGAPIALQGLAVQLTGPLSGNFTNVDRNVIY